MKRIGNGFLAAILAAIVPGTLGAPAGASVIASNAVEVSTETGLVGLVDVTDQTGPTGWILNYCGAAPPCGVSFDIDNSSGYGAGPNGGAELYFAVPASTAFSDLPQGSHLASHASDVPFGFVDLIDDAGGHGPIVPVPEPEPESLALVAVGLALVGSRRLRSAA
jgi:hypothetical protein